MSLGGGSGLLELTQERYDTSLGDVSLPPSLDAGANPDPMASPASRTDYTAVPSPTVPPELPTARLEAEDPSSRSRLADAYKAEMKRARRSGALAWFLVVLLLLGCGTAGWWGMHQNGLLERERGTTASLRERTGDYESNLAEWKTRTSRLQEEIKVVRTEIQGLKADAGKLRSDKDAFQTERTQLLDQLASTREKLAESNASVLILTLSLIHI